METKVYIFKKQLNRFHGILTLDVGSFLPMGYLISFHKNSFFKKTCIRAFELVGMV